MESKLMTISVTASRSCLHHMSRWISKDYQPHKKLPTVFCLIFFDGSLHHCIVTWRVAGSHLPSVYPTRTLTCQYTVSIFLFSHNLFLKLFPKFSMGNFFTLPLCFNIFYNRAVVSLPICRGRFFDYNGVWLGWTVVLYRRIQQFGRFGQCW